MHSPSALTEHVSLNLAGIFLLDPVHAGKRYQQQCAWIVFVPAVVPERSYSSGGDKTARETFGVAPNPNPTVFLSFSRLTAGSEWEGSSSPHRFVPEKGTIHM